MFSDTPKSWQLPKLNKMSFKSKSLDSKQDLNVSDSRKRQSKRDDAIRRKIEHDLNKKRKNSTQINRFRKGTPGSVLSLRPSDPILCKKNATGLEVSQLMTAKRENCILVTDDKGGLLGIFTAKDLAFRIVGSKLNANVITIDQIMTSNPICVDTNTSASDALNLMVEKGFRHLPIVDHEHKNTIVGVLDITKCYAQQMEKLERMHESSKKLYEALDSVQSEMGMIEQPLQVLKYFEELRSKMNGPVLNTVLDDSTIPVYISIKSTVYDATVLMKENKTTAVLVKDNDDKVNGIFTSKDVVLRVIAAGLDPKNCSIVRVMTPQPDIAAVSLPIQEALRKMFDGHYLNLPITNENNEIIGIVDVLKLTYATLNQIKLINSPENDNDTDTENTKTNDGPAWNKFWTSLDHESDSLRSDSISAVDAADSQAQESSKPPGDSSVDAGGDIKPSDSISHFNSPVRERQTVNTNFEEIPFTFKFRTSPIDNRVHRISLKPIEGIEKLRSMIDERLLDNDFDHLKVTKLNTPGADYAISYTDDEGDIVSITSNDDLIDCVKINLQLSNDKADLYIHNPYESAPVESIKRSKKIKSKQASQASGGLFLGISTDILIPGAVMVLATSAVIGYTFNRK